MNNRGGGGATNADQLAQMRYIAMVQRRSMPPRCNPVTILVLVLSLGTLFIGLTMTVIAHWPGSTSIGENPLKIAGPILLSVGGAAFIVGICLVCYLNKREQTKWVKNVTNLAQSKLTLNQSSSSLPGSKATKDIVPGQKNNASMKGSEYDGRYPPMSQPHQKLLPDSSDSQQFTSSLTYTEDYPDYGSKKMGLMQQPPPQNRQYSAKELADMSGESDIPDPVRIKKKKQTGSSAENLNASETEVLLQKSRMQQQQQTRAWTQDASQSDEDVFNMSADGDDNIPGAIRKKKKKNLKSSRENLNAPERDELLNNSHDYRESKNRSSVSSRKNNETVEMITTTTTTSSYRSSVSKHQANEEELSRFPDPPLQGKTKPAVAAKPSKGAKPPPRPTEQPPSPGEARRLRVHVKAQPGATIHIQHGTPPQSRHGTLKSTASGETDL